MASDLDLAILLSGDQPGEVLAYGIWVAEDWREELSKILPVPVDLQFADPLTDERVWPAVLEHGVLIYRARTL